MMNVPHQNVYTFLTGLSFLPNWPKSYYTKHWK